MTQHFIYNETIKSKDLFSKKLFVFKFKILDEILKHSNYETSLSKFWKENFKQDTENVKLV